MKEFKLLLKFLCLYHQTQMVHKCEICSKFRDRREIKDQGQRSGSDAKARQLLPVPSLFSGTFFGLYHLLSHWLMSVTVT